jgi:DNA replication protein DnaD
VDFESGAKQQISPVVKRGLSELAASKGMSEDDLMNSTKKMMAYFESRSKPEMDKLQAMIDKGSNDSKEAKEQMLGKALAQYGFQWAANASKPGARLLSSAAESSPAIAQSVAESQKLARDIEQNQLKLNMSMQQFRIAQSKGDEQAAINFAQQVRQLKQSEQMLELKRQELGMQGQAMGMKQNQFNAMLGARMASAGAQNKQAQARLAKVGTDASFKYDENNRRTRDELISKHGPVAGDAMYKLGRKQYINDAMQYASDSMSDTQSSGGGGGGARNVFDLLED